MKKTKTSTLTCKIQGKKTSKTFYGIETTKPNSDKIIKLQYFISSFFCYYDDNNRNQF